jgi:glucose-6-phosphate isomerase
LSGKTVNQGISVFGNKGSTDQHAYVQQLIDGKDDFFLTLIEVLKDPDTAPFFVEPGVTSGDYLHGFYLGTREAISSSEKSSVTLTVSDTSAFTVGLIIALFERTVGLYASLININAYHQPGVEAGKKAATSALELQQQIVNFLASKAGTSFTVQQIVSALKASQKAEQAFKICEHLAANPSRGIQVRRSGIIFDSKYLYSK